MNKKITTYKLLQILKRRNYNGFRNKCNRFEYIECRNQEWGIVDILNMDDTIFDFHEKVMLITAVCNFLDWHTCFNICCEYAYKLLERLDNPSNIAIDLVKKTKIVKDFKTFNDAISTYKEFLSFYFEKMEKFTPQECLIYSEIRESIPTESYMYDRDANENVFDMFLDVSCYDEQWAKAKFLECLNVAL